MCCFLRLAFFAWKSSLAAPPLENLASGRRSGRRKMKGLQNIFLEFASPTGFARLLVLRHVVGAGTKDSNPKSSFWEFASPIGFARVQVLWQRVSEYDVMLFKSSFPEKGSPWSQCTGNFASNCCAVPPCHTRRGLAFASPIGFERLWVLW